MTLRSSSQDQVDRLSSFQRLEEYIDFQLVSRKEPVFEEGLSRSGTTDMMSKLKAYAVQEEAHSGRDIESEECAECASEDFLMAFKGFLKSKGGGKGAANFDGDCYYCRKKGHRQWECRQRAADVQAGKVAPLPPKGLGKGEVKGARDSGNPNNLFAWMDHVI